ncbi:hypothetical protein GW17_00046442, partial [Ensete ventricosum]
KEEGRMKSPLRLFRGLKLGRQEAKEEKQQHRPPMNMDKLIQATQFDTLVLSGDRICRIRGAAVIAYCLQQLLLLIMHMRLDILRTMDKPSRSLLREFEVVEVCFL